VFNLLPIPPLDGSKILFAFLPDRIVYKIYEKEQIISVVLMALLFMGVLSIPLAFLSGLVNNLVSFISKLPFALIFG
jgi:Zn-dependent protease